MFNRYNITAKEITVSKEDEWTGLTPLWEHVYVSWPRTKWNSPVSVALGELWKLFCRLVSLPFLCSPIQGFYYLGEGGVTATIYASGILEYLGSTMLSKIRLRAVPLQSVQSKLGRTGESEMAARETGERRLLPCFPSASCFLLSLASLDFLVRVTILRDC